MLAPNVPLKTHHRIQRWFDHADMKKICGHFLPAQLTHPLLHLIGTTASDDLQTVARNFIQLQEARHLADYDLSYALTRFQALRFVELARDAFVAWARIRNTAEANIFILSLVLWKNWTRDR